MKPPGPHAEYLTAAVRVVFYVDEDDHMVRRCVEIMVGHDMMGVEQWGKIDPDDRTAVEIAVLALKSIAAARSVPEWAKLKAWIPVGPDGSV